MTRVALLALGIALLLPSAAHAGPPHDLLGAYKKEFAFLEAQKRALAERVKALKAANKARVDRAQKAIAALSVRLLGLRASADRLQETLRNAERENGGAADDDQLATTVERAAASLKKVGLALPEPDANAAAQTKDPKDPKNAKAQLERLRQAFELGATAVARLGAVRVERGHFFLPDGSRTAGKLVRVGGIATYGISDKGPAGALAPAGDGRLKLWPKDAATSARALAAGKRPPMLSIFVYESLQKEIVQKKAKTVRELLAAGGLIAWIIAGLGALTALMILARLSILALAGLRGKGLSSRVLPLVARGQAERAAALCKRAGGSLGRVLTQTLENLHRPRQQLEDHISEAVLHEQPRLSRFGAAITVAAAVAPLLGLLGTVTGMISTFDIITEHGTGDPKLLSSGISEALITTELGLIVAIPTLLIGTLLSGWSQSIEGQLERAALGLLNSPRAPEARSLASRPPTARVDEANVNCQASEGAGAAPSSGDDGPNQRETPLERDDSAAVDTRLPKKLAPGMAASAETV